MQGAAGVCLDSGGQQNVELLLSRCKEEAKGLRVWTCYWKNCVSAGSGNKLEGEPNPHSGQAMKRQTAYVRDRGGGKQGHSSRSQVTLLIHWWSHRIGAFQEKRRGAQGSLPVPSLRDEVHCHVTPRADGRLMMRAVWERGAAGGKPGVLGKSLSQRGQ